MTSLTKEKRYDMIIMLSIQLLGTWITYSISIIFTLNWWFTEYILLNFNLNKVNASDTEAAFLDLNLSIHNNTVSTKIYDKWDDFDVGIVNFPFLDGDVPRCPSYGVYISQLIRFARASSHVNDFNNRNIFLTAKPLNQSYRYHKLRRAFSKFYRRHFELIE